MQTLKEFIVRSLSEIEGTVTERIDFDIAVEPRDNGEIYVSPDSGPGLSRIQFSVNIAPQLPKDKKEG